MSEVREGQLNNAVLLYKGNGDEDGWYMYAWSDKDAMQRDMLTGDESFLTHKCPHKEWVSEVYIFPDTHKNCWRCTEPVPDGLRALWIMHNGII